MLQGGKSVIGFLPPKTGRRSGDLAAIGWTNCKLTKSEHSSSGALLTNKMLPFEIKDLNASFCFFSREGKNVFKRRHMPRLKSALPFSNKSPRRLNRRDILYRLHEGGET